MAGRGVSLRGLDGVVEAVAFLTAVAMYLPVLHRGEGVLNAARYV